MFVDKYQPSVQKALFHKDVIAHIRKWIKNIEDTNDVDEPIQHILFVYGPVGCGKSVTFKVLLKGFNVFNIDSSELRSNENISELSNQIAGYNDMTLSNIDKWNHKNRTEKCNLVLVDNAELCEKTITSFVEVIYNKKNINVPVIIICNNQKLKDAFIGLKNFTCIEFNKPSLLELTKLISEINECEKLELTNVNIKHIIEHSKFDIRQVLFILEQWKVSGSEFDEFIENIASKHADIDLSNKLLYLFDGSKKFDMAYSFNLCSSEPMTISSGIYQNYLTAIESGNQDASTLKHMCKVIDSVSEANIKHSQIFSDQIWELYEVYTMESCVVPSFYVKECTLHENTFFEKQYYNKIVPFKDVSYNFQNSLDEVRSICNKNIYSRYAHLYGSSDRFADLFAQNNLDSYFFLAKILVSQIKRVNEHFDANKRGKNTSKSEKINLCNNIKDVYIQQTFDTLVHHIVTYKLYETDLDDLIINRSRYTREDDIIDNLTKIDLRLLKRFINIFTLFDTKVLKSHVEMALKYKILQHVVHQIHDHHKEIAKTVQNTNIEHMTEDLDKIWNF